MKFEVGILLTLVGLILSVGSGRDAIKRKWPKVGEFHLDFVFAAVSIVGVVITFLQNREDQKEKLALQNQVDRAIGTASNAITAALTNAESISKVREGQKERVQTTDWARLKEELVWVSKSRPITMTWTGADSETMRFGQKFFDFLQDSNFKPAPGSGTVISPDPFPPGVTINRPTSVGVRAFVESLKTALERAGVQTGLGSEAADDSVVLVIGPKPVAH